MIDYPKIKHVKKALLLIQYGLDNFCDQFVADITVQVSVIQRITKYRYYKNGETDIAGPVREEAAKILLKLSEEEKLQEMRQAHHSAQPAGKVPEEEVGSSTPAQDIATPEENDVTTEEAQAVKFDDFGSGSINISGRLGSNAGRVNGVFVVREGKDVGGRTSYAREDGHVLDTEDPICMWFSEKFKSWMISKESYIGTENAYALVTCAVENPVDIPPNTVWKVFDKDEGKYVD